MMITTIRTNTDKRRKLRKIEKSVEMLCLNYDGRKGFREGEMDRETDGGRKGGEKRRERRGYTRGIETEITKRKSERGRPREKGEIAKREQREGMRKILKGKKDKQLNPTERRKTKKKREK